MTTDKEKLERIKEKTGISDLDNETRKELFDRFVDAGGEVLDERQKRRQMMIDREKQRAYQQRLDSHHEKVRAQKKPEKKISSPVSGTQKKTANKPEEAQSGASRYFTGFKIRFKLKLMKVAWFNGLYFNIKFLERFNNTYKTALMQIQVVYLDLFKKNPDRGRRLIMRLDKQRPLLYELLEMISSIYDKMTADQIVDHYVNFPDVPKKLSELREPLMEIYRRLYILKPYENTILLAFEKALESDSKLVKRETPVSSSRKQIKNELYTVFHKLFPRLHMLFCFYQSQLFDIDDPQIEYILNISKAEKPGRRKLYDRRKDENSTDDTSGTSSTEEESETATPDHIRKGLEILANLNIADLRKKYDAKDMYLNVENRDKVLVTYLYFSEFDHEYSCILTTNKIKYNIDFSQAGKLDYRAKMQDLYDLMRKCTDALRDYADTYANYEKVRMEKPTGSNQYIQYSKRLEAIQKKRIQSGKVARATVRAYMEKIAQEIKILIDDMEGEQKYISNPQEELEFEAHIEGEKKINGMKVYAAIQKLYQYSSAFSYRLSADGDLSGKLEFEQAVGNQEEEDQKDDSPRSIFDELDDML